MLVALLLVALFASVRGMKSSPLPEHTHTLPQHDTHTPSTFASEQPVSFSPQAPHDAGSFDFSHAHLSSAPSFSAYPPTYKMSRHDDTFSFFPPFHHHQQEAEYGQEFSADEMGPSVSTRSSRRQREAKVDAPDGTIDLNPNVQLAKIIWRDFLNTASFIVAPEAKLSQDEQKISRPEVESLEEYLKTGMVSAEMLRSFLSHDLATALLAIFQHVPTKIFNSSVDPEEVYRLPPSTKDPSAFLLFSQSPKVSKNAFPAEIAVLKSEEPRFEEQEVPPKQEPARTLYLIGTGALENSATGEYIVFALYGKRTWPIGRIVIVLVVVLAIAAAVFMFIRSRNDHSGDDNEDEDEEMGGAK